MQISTTTGSEPGTPATLNGFPFLMSPKCLAAMTQKSVRTVYRDLAEGLLPEPIKVGKVLRWRGQDIVHWIDLGCPPKEQYEALIDRSR